MTNHAETLAWRKAKRSSATGSDCVEVADLPDGGKVVRNSQHPQGPTLRFNAREWDAFLDGARNGEFD